jgi:hypothetical protein
MVVLYLYLDNAHQSFSGESDIVDNCFIIALKDAINNAILYIETQQKNRQSTIAQLDFWNQLRDGLATLSENLIRP